MLTRYLDLPVDKITAFCEQHPIRKLSLFGSVLRNDFRTDSDVDLLVEYENGASITYLDMAQQEIELAAIIGRKVDLREPQELSRYFRQKVVETAVTLYERE